ncbi:Vancomycin resistance protein YoaR, contains peptidoglycan-binding and VanW domains [Nocardioides terrae]|uniref:Vancomycin resistance protein YoaR, contains peptidoglycan-binding and VanW domains n=1 Tax=Nocardioides terrae TaxID=574651 RepID=A0A1I1DRD0_9ACTN|nr:VanW family protein [Nocardioides terrae]SFB77569.1 Vancomycin resistance protein YoaR, contains peptidoglycan-binding and VanW domains [Nocardioides terrae]
MTKRDEAFDDTAERPAVKMKRERAGFGVVLVVVVVLAVLVGGGWAAAYAMAGDKIANGTTVAGVRIGNLTPAAAQRKLRDALAGRVDRPVTVTANGASTQVKPADAGVSIDYAATVADAGAARSWDPRDLWNHYTGGGRVDPVVEVDQDALDKTKAVLDKSLGTAAKDGAVTLGKEGVRTAAAVTGAEVDGDELRAGLVAAVSGDRRTLDLKLHEVKPDIDDADVRSAVDSFANPAMSGPVTLMFGSSPVVLRPTQFGPALKLEPKDGTLQPTLDQKALDALVSAGIAERADAPVDATVKLVHGKPKVIPAKPGVSFDPQQVAGTFLALVTKPEGQRQQAVDATVADPKISTAQAQAWQIKEKVSTFTTYFPYAEYRNTNIGRAAQLVNGTILEPGDTFSLNDTVGERTRENGFTEGWTIQNGVFFSDLGGGVSQMATTTFNAMFFAGLKDVEHKPHSLYISRYPVGREATVAWGSVDLKFANDTPYGILVHTEFKPSTPSSQGSVTVSMWSTKTWDITTKTGDRYNQTPFKKRVIHDTNCEATSGAPGFDIDVWRYFHKPGSTAVEKTEKFHTHYIPQDDVTCKAPKKGQ